MYRNLNQRNGNARLFNKGKSRTVQTKPPRTLTKIVNRTSPEKAKTGGTAQSSSSSVPFQIAPTDDGQTKISWSANTRAKRACARPARRTTGVHLSPSDRASMRCSAGPRMSVVSSYWDLQRGSSSYLFGKVNNLESMLVGAEEKPMCLVWWPKV